MDHQILDVLATEAGEITSKQLPLDESFQIAHGIMNQAVQQINIVNDVLEAGPIDGEKFATYAATATSAATTTASSSSEPAATTTTVTQILLRDFTIFWRQGLASELQRYEARGYWYTRFQLLVTIAICLLVAFSLEFHEWAKALKFNTELEKYVHYWTTVDQQQQGKQRRRGKRERIIPKEVTLTSPQRFFSRNNENRGTSQAVILSAPQPPTAAAARPVTPPILPIPTRPLTLPPRAATGRPMTPPIPAVVDTMSRIDSAESTRHTGADARIVHAISDDESLTDDDDGATSGSSLTYASCAETLAAETIASSHQRSIVVIPEVPEEAQIQTQSQAQAIRQLANNDDELPNESSSDMVAEGSSLSTMQADMAAGPPLPPQPSLPPLSLPLMQSPLPPPFIASETAFPSPEIAQVLLPLPPNAVLDIAIPSPEVAEVTRAVIIDDNLEENDQTTSERQAFSTTRPPLSLDKRGVTYSGGTQNLQQEEVDQNDASCPTSAEDTTQQLSMSIIEPVPSALSTATPIETPAGTATDNGSRGPSSPVARRLAAMKRRSTPVAKQKIISISVDGDDDDESSDEEDGDNLEAIAEEEEGEEEKEDNNDYTADQEGDNNDKVDDKEEGNDLLEEERDEVVKDNRRRHFADSHDQEESADDGLEEIAMALKLGLSFVKIKIQSKRLKKKVYPDCFSGSAAVDFLSQHLRKPRAEAKQVGRKIAQRYNLFIKCGGNKKNQRRKQDDPNGLQRMSSVSQLSVSQLNTSIQDSSNPDGQEEEEGEHQYLKPNLLHDSRSTYYRLFAYLPSEVDNMPIVQKIRIFEGGVRTKKHRTGFKKNKNSFSGKDAVNCLVRYRLAASRQEAVDLCNKFVVEFNLFEPLNRMDPFEDSKQLLYRFIDKTSRYFNIDDEFSTTLIGLQGNDVDWASNDDLGASSHYSGISLSESESDDDEEEGGHVHEVRISDYQRLCEVAVILERGIKRKKGQFAASRVVTFMVTSGLANSRKEAEVTGRRLEREFNLIREVTGKHDFSDANHFFRFTEKYERHMGPLKINLPLEEIGLALEEGVKVKDYFHNLKTYKNTFGGAKAVNFLVNSRLASSRLEAVRIGQLLSERYNLFTPVTGNREFCDNIEYFRFTPPAERRKPEADEPMLQEKLKITSTFLSPATITPEALYELAQWFLSGVHVKENKFRAKAYRQTFVGNDAVAYLVNNSRAISRKEAVELGRLLSQGLGLFHGIDGSLDFKDDYLLYRFAEQWQNESGGLRASVRQGTVTGLEGISGVSAKSLPLEKVAKAFRHNMTVSDNRRGVKTHKDSFLGREGVDFFVGHGLAQDRVAAVDLGRALAREFQLFKNVEKKHELKDAKHLYKFQEGPIRPLEVIEFDDKKQLAEIGKGFMANVRAKKHQKNMLVFENTFVGSEAVDYLVDSQFASSRMEAVQIGRAITREFNLFEHVTQDRKFEDSTALFYFEREEYHYKGLLFVRQVARRQIFIDNDDSSIGSNGISVSSINFAAGELHEHQIAEEDAERANKIILFQNIVQEALNPFSRIVNDDDDSMECHRKETINRCLRWASKFRRLDPRYQIQHFFDCAGQDGANNMEYRDFSTQDLSPLRYLLPKKAQFFTVWRPTSLDAIRRMMCGLAVGKGLDIKGKSAKRGKLSGFVPFLQISVNKHKSKIRPPSKDGVVRVFYPAEARRARDLAAEILERVAQEMTETVEKAKEVLADNNSPKEAQEDALEAMLLDMKDPRILYIDSYAPQRYGFEIPERLFWEAYFTQQDCTREPGSQYDTGRPSQPAFQDMNFAALRAQPKEDAPRACVYQNADPGQPMNPFEMLVAYEEHGRVMPVVSDFDCFLVGTKGVSFTSSLEPSQMSVLSWYVTELETVLGESRAGDSWTVRWLDVLKKAAREGRYPEMPQFGFGDPKSYSIMKSAVTSLTQTGAVRHGAECFNFYFPQDLDDDYLVVADGLPGNQPWLYVDGAGLAEILSRKIDQGFTFPLNPKWVLCDSNKWYELYQKLLKSDREETQQSMNIWYPPESGLREQIERVHKIRPEGFYQEPAAADDEASAHGSTVAPTSSKGKNKDHLMSLFAMGLMEKPQDEMDLSSAFIAEAKVKAKSLKSKVAKKMKKKLFGKSSNKSDRSEDCREDDTEDGGDNTERDESKRSRRTRDGKRSMNCSASASSVGMASLD